MGDNVGKVRDLVVGRMCEPSSWAAVAAMLIGLSMVVSQGWMLWGGIIAAVGALVLKERGSA